MYKSKSIITLTLVAIMMFIALISNYIIINYQYFRINNLSKKLFSNTNNYNELSRKNKNLEYNIIYYDKLYQDLQEKSHEAENRLQELEDLQNEIINRLSLSIDNNIIEQRHLDSSPTTSLTELNNKIIKNILNYKALLNDFSNEKLTPSIKPAQGIISSLVGFRPNPITNHTEYHTGLDIAASIGTQVVATASGEVTFADYRNGYGLLVIIDHKNGYQTYYAHLSKVMVKAGDFVKKSDAIAKTGDTGNTTGPHLHYEVRFYNSIMNPQNYFY